MIQAIGINLTPKIRQQSQLKPVQFTEEASPVQMELSDAEVKI